MCSTSYTSTSHETDMFIEMNCLHVLPVFDGESVQTVAHPECSAAHVLTTHGLFHMFCIKKKLKC